MLLSLNGASASVVHNTSMDDNSAVIVAPWFGTLYDELSSLIDLLGDRRIGFEKGEYAPFNNREVIKTYKEARQYLESTTENDADYEKLQQYVDVLCDTVNTWKKNAERINAIYNPSFSLVKPNYYSDLPGWAIHDETVPTPRMGLFQCTSVTSSSDWDMFDNAKGSVNLDGEENTFSTAAKFVFENNALDFCSTRSVYSYGDEEGYELPLVPGKTYKFSAQVGNCGTKGAVTFDVYNARTGKFIGFTECEPQVCLFEHSERPEEIYFTFKTGAVDDYDNTLKNYSEHENYRLVMRNSNVNAVWSLVMSNLSLKMVDEPGEKTDTIKIDVTTPVGNELQNVTVQQIDLPDEDDCESTVYSAIDESKDMIVTFKVPVEVVLSDNKYYIVITMRPVCGSRARPSYLEFGLKGVPTRLQTKAPVEDEEYMSLGQYVYTGEKEETFVLEYNGTDDITDASVVITSKAPEGKEHEGSIVIKDISLVSGNNITGIRPARQTKTDVPSGIYTIQGTRINSIRKGMNLVRMNDGSFRKIIY